MRPRRAAVFRLEPGARVRAKFREGWALGRIVERSERTWMVKYDDGEMRDDVSDYLLKEPQEPTLPGDGLSGGSESPLPVLNATPSALPIHPDEPDVSAASIAAALSFEAGVQAQTEPRLFHNYALSGKLYESSLGGNSRKLSFVEALSQCAVPLPNKPHTHKDARLEAAWRAGDEDGTPSRNAARVGSEDDSRMTAPYVKMLTGIAMSNWSSHATAPFPSSRWACSRPTLTSGCLRSS